MTEPESKTKSNSGEMTTCRDCGKIVPEMNMNIHQARACSQRARLKPTIANNSTVGNKRKVSEGTPGLTEPRNTKSPRAFESENVLPEEPVSNPTANKQSTTGAPVKKVACKECGCRVREANMTKHLEFSCSRRARSAKLVVCCDEKNILDEDIDEKCKSNHVGEVVTDSSSSDDDISPDLPTSKPTIQPAGIEGVVDLCSDDEIVSSSKSRDDGQIIDKDLRRVYAEVDISSTSIRQLKKHGITNLTELLNRQEELKAGALVNVKTTTQKRLHTFCLWYHDFYAEHANHVSWQGCFDNDENLLADFEQEVRLSNSASMSELAIPILFDHAVHMLHEGGMGNLNSLPDSHYELMYEYAAKKVSDNMSTELRERCHFPIESFAFKIIKAIFNLPSGKPSKKTFLVNGKTQAGKTAFNALMVVISETLQCMLLNITKGCSESDDLREKLKGYLSKSKTRKNIFQHFSRKEGEAWVIADTHTRIDSAVRDIEGRRKVKASGKFWVVFDEADTNFRTAGREQRMEKASDALMQLGPCVRILLSATSVPCVLGSLDEGGADSEILQVGTAGDYCGIDEMKPLKDASGNCTFLRRDEITSKDGVDYHHAVVLGMEACDKKALFNDNIGQVDIESKKFPRCDDLDFIPYTSDSVLRVFDVALTDSSKKGTLILDCTATYVNVGYTIFHKAACLQNHYHEKGKPMIVVVYVGQHIHFRRPAFSRGRFVSSKKKTISQVLEKLDEEFGLNMPIAVFGYIKMRRCISYRSNLRVPTHLILRLGKGHSNENFVQALGRGTGNLKSALKANGHECVTLLTDRNDFLMATKYEQFCPEIQDRLADGHSLEEAIKGADRKFPDSSNFLRHTNRKVGQRKDFRSKCPGQNKFEEPIDFELNGRDFTCVMIQGVLRAMHDLVKEDGKDLFTVKDIEKKFNDTYQKGDRAITKHELKDILRGLCDKDTLQPDGADAAGLKRYAAKDLNNFDSLINPDLDDHFTAPSEESRSL